MDSHCCLLCMGSNTFAEENLALGREELAIRFPGIVFGREMITEPLYFTSNRTPFRNQLALFHSELGAEEIVTVCKMIERKAGRLPEDKAQETVRLDIDLLKMDHWVLKPGDLEREYIREGVREFECYFQ